MANQRGAVSSAVLSPPWLVAPESNAQKYMFCIGLALDALLEKQFQAQRAKLPGLSDDSAIPLQAADRVMVQGPAETNPQFTLRLQGALDAWARAGARSAILGQIQAYLTNLQPNVAVWNPECLIVGGNASLSTWDTIYFANAQGAAPAHRTITPANWNWDGKSQPWRAWLILFMFDAPTGQSGVNAVVASVGGSGVAGVTSGFATITGLSGMVAGNVLQYLTLSGFTTPGNNGKFQITSVVSPTSVIIANTAAAVESAVTAWSVSAYPFIGPGPVWGSPSFVWGSSTWGLNCSPQVIQSIRQILATWKSAGTYYPKIIISFGGGDSTAGKEFSPNSSQGSGNPDGTWADFGKNVGGVWIPAKQPLNPFTAFCDGTGVSLQCYEKNRT